MTKGFDMSDQTDESASATVQVIKGGNRIMEIRAHCVCRDHNGQLQWEDDAVGTIIIPAGIDLPKFVVEGPIETRIVPKEEG